MNIEQTAQTEMHDSFMMTYILQIIGNERYGSGSVNSFAGEIMQQLAIRGGASGSYSGEHSVFWSQRYATGANVMGRNLADVIKRLEDFAPSIICLCGCDYSMDDSHRSLHH